MRALLMTLPLAVTLAACDTSPTVSAENASVEDVARQVAQSGAADSIRMNPGQWVTEARLDNIDMPGLAPSAVEQMKSVMASQVSGHKYCLTPEQAAKPSEDFFSGQQSGCTYDRFDMKGGKISGVMRCNQGGASQTIGFDGEYAPNQYNMRMESTVDGGAQGPMTMAMSINSKRIGDCPSGKAGIVN